MINCKPISVLSPFAKILEKILYQRYTLVQINLNTPQINQKIQYFFEQSILFNHNAYFSPQISCN